MNEQKNNTNDKWTKLIFAVLLFFGISTLLLGILRLNSLIYNQFPVSSTDQTGLNNSADNLKAKDKQPTITELMKRDTDGDGLSDYEELYIYHTSIYLKDTDGDGYSDKEEIDNGYDPNCPKGKDCRGVENNAQTNLNSSQPNQADLNTGQTNPTEINNNNLDQLTPEQKQQLMNLSPEDIRQLLLSSGKISPDELNKIDDESLKQALKDILSQ